MPFPEPKSADLIPKDADAAGHPQRQFKASHSTTSRASTDTAGGSYATEQPAPQGAQAKQLEQQYQDLEKRVDQAAEAEKFLLSAQLKAERDTVRSALQNVRAAAYRPSICSLRVISGASSVTADRVSLGRQATPLGHPSPSTAMITQKPFCLTS